MCRIHRQDLLLQHGVVWSLGGETAETSRACDGAFGEHQSAGATAL